MDLNSLSTQEALDRISRHCPEALYVYLQCANRADEDGTVYFTQEQIEVELSEDYIPFRSLIKKLARENLLEWHPVADGFSVTLMDDDYDGE